MWRSISAAAAVAGAMVAAVATQTPAPTPHAALVIVVDGLRPDYVTPALMPRLVRLGQRGVVFTAHHSVFPTVTRVNASSMATGSYPESHGILGNAVYAPAVNATRGLDTGSRENLEAIARASGPLLTAPSLGEILPAAGKKILVAGAGSSGAAFLLNHTVGTGAIIHQEFTRPESLGAHVLETLGPPPASAMPNAALNKRAVDAYLALGLDEMRADLTMVWLSVRTIPRTTRGSDRRRRTSRCVWPTRRSAASRTRCRRGGSSIARTSSLPPITVSRRTPAG